MNQDKINDIKALCEKFDFDFIDYSRHAKMIGNKKQQLYVRFICRKHSKFGIQEKSLDDLRRLKKPCPYCSHMRLKETFKDDVAEINPNIEIRSEFINTNTNVKCYCKIHNYEWDANPRSLLNGSGCRFCGIEKVWEQRGRKTTDEFKNEMKLINPNIKIIGEYSGSHKLIKCQCLIDGTIWESFACNLLNKSAGCPTCDARGKSESQRLSIEDMNNRIKDILPHITILDGYTNNKSYIKCKCNTHNTIYTVSAKTILYNHSSGCPECNQSLGEIKMLKILEKLGYNIKTQYKFNDCKYINLLSFDGFNEENNIAFEYQGQQHYHPVDFGGKGEEVATEQFEKNIIRDGIKKEYCKKHNIYLIEIPYWEYDNMESFLCNELNKYCCKNNNK